MKKIMLVDDSITIHRVIDLSLDEEKYQVVKTFSADEAMQKLNEITPDIVLLDNKLPDVKIDDFIREIKSKVPQIVVILLVGAFDSFDEADLEKYGADSYLLKPFNSQALEEAIEKYSKIEITQETAVEEETGQSEDVQELLSSVEEMEPEVDKELESFEDIISQEDEQIEESLLDTEAVEKEESLDDIFKDLEEEITKAETDEEIKEEDTDELKLDITEESQAEEVQELADEGEAEAEEDILKELEEAFADDSVKADEDETVDLVDEQTKELDELEELSGIDVSATEEISEMDSEQIDEEKIVGEEVSDEFKAQEEEVLKDIDEIESTAELEDIEVKPEVTEFIDERIDDALERELALDNKENIGVNKDEIEEIFNKAFASFKDEIKSDIKNEVTKDLIKGILGEILTEELLKEVMQEILKENLEKVIWEIVPELAEKLIIEEIERLKKGVKEDEEN
ncbi:response regulator [Deferribacter thermophilus]|uniref:response regulator n=1 Tax=Deferribacter thermophilus TaxID=53573 RepID=UPI003C23F2BE